MLRKCTFRKKLLSSSGIDTKNYANNLYKKNYVAYVATDLLYSYFNRAVNMTCIIFLYI